MSRLIRCTQNSAPAAKTRSAGSSVASECPELLKLGLVIRRDEPLEGPLSCCAKGRLLVARDSQEGGERCHIFPLASGQVLFHICLVQGGEGGEFMFGMQEAVFVEPGAT